MSNNKDDLGIIQEEAPVSYVAVTTFLHFLLRESNLNVAYLSEALTLGKKARLLMEEGDKVTEIRVTDKHIADHAKALVNMFLCKEG